MADRVITFQLKGDASNLERELKSVDRRMEAIAGTAQAMGGILKTAIGVGLGISIDKVREVMIRFAGATAKVFAETKTLAPGVKKVKGELVALRTQAIAPLLPVMNGMAGAIANVLKELKDSPEISAFGTRVKDAILNFAIPAFSALVAAIESTIAGFVPMSQGIEAMSETAKGFLLLVRGHVIQSAKAFKSAADIALESKEGWEGLTDQFTEIIEKASALNVELIKLGKTTGDAAPPGGGPGGGGKGGKKSGGGVGGGTDAASALDDVLKILGDDVGILSVVFGEELVGAINLTSTAMSRATAAAQKFQEEGGAAMLGAAQDIGSAVEDLASQIGSNIADEMDSTASEIEDLENRISTATSEGAKKRLLIRKKEKEKELAEQKKAAMAAWVVGHVAAIAQAAINIPLAVSGGLAMGGPQGIAFAIAGGIAAGVALAAVVAEPPPSFHSGGLITSSSIGNQDARQVSARDGEFMVNNAGVRRAGRGALEALNSGQGGGGGGQRAIVMFNDRDLDRMNSSRLRAQGSPLQMATAKGSRSRYSSGKARTG